MDIEPLPITSFLQISFSWSKTREMLDKLLNLYRGLTQFSFVCVDKGKWQHLISSGINQTQRSKP